MRNPHFPRHPFYVVSKGRSQYMMTSIQLTRMGMPHYVVVEPQELGAYKAAIEKRNLLATILPLDMAYKDNYELCDRLGHLRGTGPGPARNYAWEHSIRLGASWYWVADDNIDGFYRLDRNRKIKCLTPGIFRAMEDFCARYSNVAMAGPNYTFFVIARQKYPPFYKNTRIYSCNLIRNDVPFRWRCRYNEDTILSIDMLKAGWCTVQFNFCLQGKTPTQVMPGGNTAEFYHREGVKGPDRYAAGGTTAKSKMLVDIHPDVARLVWRYGRVHHQLDYRQFLGRPLRLRNGVIVPAGPNNYGMSLRSL